MCRNQILCTLQDTNSILQENLVLHSVSKISFLVDILVCSTESTTDGYNPEDPGLTATTAAPSSFLPGPLLNPGPLLPRPFPPPHHQTHPPHMHGHIHTHIYTHVCENLFFSGVPTLPPFPVGAFPPPPLPPPITSSASHQFPPPSHSHWPRPPQLSFPPMPRQPSDTLIVRKIPRESNTITKLSSHFEKFGTIVNLTVSLICIFHVFTCS